MDLRRAGEFGYLEALRARLPASGAVVGPGDDAAVLPVSNGSSLVATTDVLVEGVHFRTDWSSPSDTGWKAAVANISDLAAMGARPRWLLCAIAADPHTSTDVLDELCDGLVGAASTHGAALVGGDLVRGDVLMLSVTALGEVSGDPLTRTGARPGDDLYVTGPLGAAACGVRLLTAGDTQGRDVEACLRAHRRPDARVREGRALREAGAHACIDLSDGLASDARRIAEMSRVGIEIDEALVPVAESVRSVCGGRGWNAAATALAGGEDYELLFAMDAQPPVGAHRIGRVVDDGLWLVRGGQRTPLPERGWAHFG